MQRCINAVNCIASSRGCVGALPPHQASTFDSKAWPAPKISPSTYDSQETINTDLSYYDSSIKLIYVASLVQLTVGLLYVFPGSKHAAGLLSHWSLGAKMLTATVRGLYSIFPPLNALHAYAGVPAPGVPSFVTFDVVLAFALLFLAMTIIPAAMIKSICRTKTWFSLLISCVVYCTSFFLLLGHQSGPEPPLGLCLINASLVYAGLPSYVYRCSFIILCLLVR